MFVSCAFVRAGALVTPLIKSTLMILGGLIEVGFSRCLSRRVTCRQGMCYCISQLDGSILRR